MPIIVRYAKWMKVSSNLLIFSELKCLNFMCCLFSFTARNKDEELMEDAIKMADEYIRELIQAEEDKWKRQEDELRREKDSFIKYMTLCINESKKDNEKLREERNNQTRMQVPLVPVAVPVYMDEPNGFPGWDRNEIPPPLKGETDDSKPLQSCATNSLKFLNQQVSPVAPAEPSVSSSSSMQRETPLTPIVERANAETPPLPTSTSRSNAETPSRASTSFAHDRTATPYQKKSRNLKKHCRKCKMEFSDFEEHRKHHYHECVKPYECSYCKKTLTSQQTFENHMLTHMQRPT